MDPNFGFNSPAIDSTTSKSGFSSARLLRRKKPTPSTRSRPNWSMNDHDFNPFRKAPETTTGPVPGLGSFGLNSDTFGTGIPGKSDGAVKGFDLDDFIDKNVVSDELSKLSIGNNRAKQSKKVSEFDKFMFFETRDGMKQLNIDETVDFRTVLKRELEKMNIGDDNAKVFTDTVITDHLKGLKMEESNEENAREDVNAKEVREEDAKGSKVEKGLGQNEGNLHSFSSGITTGEGSEGDRCEDQTTSTSSASCMWNGDPFPGIRNVFGVPLRDRDEEKAKDYMGMEDLGFGALNLEGGLNEKPETAKVSRYRKRKGKVRKHIPTPSCPVKDSIFVEKPQVNDEFVEQYSPMGVSPYRDTLTDEVFSQQTCVVSDQKLMNDERDFFMESQVEACSDVREEEYGMRHTKEAEPSYTCGKDIDTQGSSGESFSDAETESFQSATDHFEYSSDSFATAASDTEVSYSSTARGYNDGVGDVNSGSSWVENVDSDFHVAPSSQSKKKNLVNVSDSVASTPLSTEKGIKSDASYPLDQWRTKAEDIACSAASNAAQELCEKWRLRGNQAYASGDLYEAEKFYTEGVNTISESETSSRSCFRALMLCYSNRAATRLSLGRIKEALEDCLKAISIDPNFPRVHIRAANCYLALGEMENASLHFERGFHAEPGISVDEKLLAEASEGLQKAKKVREIFKLSAELLQRRKSADAEMALLLIDEALTLSPYSEELLERKADALLMMQKYEDVIQLCGPNLNASESESSQSDNHQPMASLPIPQRMLLIAKAYFYMGRLENALDLLKNRELLLDSDKCGSLTMKSLTSFAGTISELLRLKECEREVAEAERFNDASFEEKRASTTRLAIALVHSIRVEDVRRGIQMLQACLNTNGSSFEVEGLYFIAVGYYRVHDLTKSCLAGGCYRDHDLLASRQFINHCLERAPTWQKALWMKMAIQSDIRRRRLKCIVIPCMIVMLVVFGIVTATVVTGMKKATHDAQNRWPSDDYN